MFRKLCKYEFKSIVRTLGPIYLAVIAVSIINMFVGVGSLTNDYYDTFLNNFSFGKNLLQLVETVSLFAYFGVMVALSVLTLIVIIQRFYKGLLSDEGYLMFTLPVKPWMLITAKGITAFVMSLASGVTAAISIMLLILGAAGPGEFINAITSPQLWAAVNRGLSEIPFWPLLALELLVLAIVSGLSQLYHLYFSMALGHLANKHRIMMSVVAFIVTSMLLSFLSGLMMILFGISIDSFSNMTESMSNSQAIMFIMNVTFLGSIVYSFIELAVFFFGTERILSKHLNLE
ncbi:hypothetical protein [Lacrimispora sp. JR3]|uniref:hypothetical protein n=1 Tax=Lacrimispora sinapis TaxID=3111456 RepID=UPI003747887F